MDLFVWHFNLQFPYFCQHICSNKCFMKIFFTFINSIHSINLLFLQIASSSWLSWLLRLKTAKGSCWWRTKFRLYTAQGVTREQRDRTTGPISESSIFARQQSSKSKQQDTNVRKTSKRENECQALVSFYPHDIGWRHLCKGVSSVKEKEWSYR